MKTLLDPKQYGNLGNGVASAALYLYRGTDRPTKKDRRAMEAFTEPVFFDDDDWDVE